MTFNRTAIMRRAWALFSEVYRYRGKGGIPFLSIGRKAFAWCLRKAWAEAREQATANIAMTAAERAQRLASLADENLRLEHADSFRQAHNLRRAAIAVDAALAA
jgi:hypothetical protein